MGLSYLLKNDFIEIILIRITQCPKDVTLTNASQSRLHICSLQTYEIDTISSGCGPGLYTSNID